MSMLSWLILSSLMMSMVISPTVTRVGKRWKVIIAGLLATGTITIAVINHQVVVTQTGNGTATVAIPSGASGGVLTPGAGWSGATAQPSQIGAFTEKPMARWDVVPYQTFTGTMNVGVVAAASGGTDAANAGIDRVEFSVNKGPWLPVVTPTANPQTASSGSVGISNTGGIVEYWVALHASDFADGSVEVRAVVYPKVGLPRVLQGAAWNYGGADNGEVSLWLFANSGGGLTTGNRYVSTTGDDSADGLTSGTAKRTIADAVHSASADIVNVYLAAGSYNAFGRLNREYYVSPGTWINIMPAPGVAAQAAILDLVDDGGLIQGMNNFQGTPLVHLKNLKIQTSIAQASTANCRLWFDGCELTMNSQISGTLIAYDTQWQGGIWCTDSYWHDIGSAFEGIGQMLGRNCKASHNGQHQFNHFALLLNSQGDHNDPLNSDPPMHPDWAYYDNSNLHNVIIQDCTGTFLNGQGLAIGERSGGEWDYADYAFVRLNIDTPGGTYNFHLMGHWKNVFFQSSTFTGSAFGSKFRPDLGTGVTVQDFVIDSTTFTPGLDLGGVTGVTIR